MDTRHSEPDLDVPQRRPRILIVEDEAVIAMELEERVTAMGYEPVGLAETDQEALELAAAQRPDICLMDINIRGERDGIEVAGTLRTSLDIPSIFITAYSDDSRITRAAAAFPFAYLTKPITDRELRAALEIGLYRQRSERELAAYRQRLERSNEELRQSLERIQQLEALLPVCAWCKDIRDDEGQWTGVFDYLRTRAGYTTSHVICPRCLQNEFDLQLPP